MTTLQKYYSNPFADDDDELCYAVIDLDRYDDATPVSTPQPSRAYQTQPQPQPYRQPQQFRGSAAPPPPATLSPAAYENTPATDRSSSNLPRGGLPAAAIVTSPKASSSTAALQRQLDEANATNQALHDEYGSFIESLREELAAANAKNLELQAKQAKLESQVRTLTIEKETAEWNVQLGKDQIQTLENNIAALEAELANDRGTGARRSIHRDSANSTPVPQQPSGARRGVPDITASPAQPSLAPTFPSHPQVANTPQRQPSQPQYQLQGSPNNVARRGMQPVTHQEHQLRLQQKQKAQQQQQQDKQAHQDPNASGTGPAAARRAKNTASVQELDSMLLFHSRRRDEITGELQRLDGARHRTAEDRRKFGNLEAALAEEDRQIGHIRLLLRSQNAIKKQ